MLSACERCICVNSYFLILFLLLACQGAAGDRQGGGSVAWAGLGGWALCAWVSVGLVGVFLLVVRFGGLG